MLAKAIKRALELLEQVPVGKRKRFDARAAPAGLLQQWYAVQPTQRIIAAVIELEQAASEQQLKAALRKLCAQHPYALGVCVERSAERLSMRPLAAHEDPPLRAPAPGHDTWSLAEDWLHEPFSAGAALFRVSAAERGKRLVCAFDHIMFDGISAGHFACALARALAGMQLAAADPDEHLPLDARADLRPSAAQLLRALREPPAPVPPMPSLQNAPISLRSHIARHEIVSTDTEQLRARARQKAVTLHAAISACALLAAAEVLDGEQRARAARAEPGSLRLHTPVSLRSRCRPQPRGFGVFIGSVDTDLNVAPHSDPWLVARQYADALARDKPNALGKVGLFALAGDLRQRALKLEAQHHGRTATLEVSNVGHVLDVPPGTNVWLTQGAHYRGPLFVLTLLESAGVVRACLSTPYPLIDKIHTTQFMQAFAAQLAKARRS
jgi:hypothetical protein